MNFKKNKLIIFDRDGTLNKLVNQDKELRSPRSLDEFKLIEGAREVLLTLKSQGNFIGIATNQPEVSRKYISIKEFMRCPIIGRTFIKYSINIKTIKEYIMPLELSCLKASIVII